MASRTAKASTTNPKDADSSEDDEHSAIEKRLFEVIYTVDADTFHEYRLRVRKGGIEDNVFYFGESACYYGLVTRKQSTGAWTPYGWGHLPAPADFVREIYDTELKKPEKKDEKKSDA